MYTTSFTMRAIRHAWPHNGTRSFTSTSMLPNTETHLPRIAKPSFLRSLIPKPFRRSSLDDPTHPDYVKPEPVKKPKTDKEYVIFIVLALIVGSNAINMLSLRNDTAAFRRKSDARIETLRDVIRRLKNGENVDVKKELGTGDPAQEAEWQEVMDELAGRDAVTSAKQKRDALRAREEELKKSSAAKEEEQRPASNAAEATTKRRPKFLM